MLSKWGLQGFSHPTGGFPAAKYYVPALHRRISSGDVLDAIAKQIGGLTSVLDLCTCPVCQRAAKEGFFNVYAFTRPGRGGKPYPTAATLTNCRDHYLYVRQQELDFLERASYSEVHAQLREALDCFPGQMSSHLERWLEALPAAG